MARPHRAEMIRRFFQELGQTAPGGETEAAIEINTRACEAILVDLIQEFDKHHAQQGEGALVLRLAGDEPSAHYVPLEDFCQDLIEAEEAGNSEASPFMREVIRSIKTTNTNEKVLILLIDRSQATLLPVPREYPAGGIRDLQQSLVRS
jgi:hypothetical protein